MAANQNPLMGVTALPPQYILAANSQTVPAATGTLPVQQLVIPVSMSNGTQQLISIPLSLAASAGNRIQLLTTNNGQIIATNLAGLSGAQANVSLPSGAGM